MSDLVKCPSCLNFFTKKRGRIKYCSIACSQKSKQLSIEELIEVRIKKENGCWIWIGSKTRLGYGGLRRNGKWRQAHRVFYEWAKGLIPDGMVLDHLCKNRACVNPDHLEPVAQAENARRGETGIAFYSRTHCKHGHEYTEENTRWDGNTRRCRACCRERALARYHSDIEKHRAEVREKAQRRRERQACAML